MSWDTVISTLIRLWTGRSGFRIPAWANIYLFQNRPDRSWDPPSLLFNWYSLLFPLGKSDREVMLTTQR